MCIRDRAAGGPTRPGRRSAVVGGRLASTLSCLLCADPPQQRAAPHAALRAAPSPVLRGAPRDERACHATVRPVAGLGRRESVRRSARPTKTHAKTLSRAVTLVCPLLLVFQSSLSSSETETLFFFLKRQNWHTEPLARPPTPRTTRDSFRPTSTARPAFRPAPCSLARSGRGRPTRGWQSSSPSTTR